MADNMDLVIRMILNAADFMAGLDEEQAKLDEIDAKHINDKSFKVDADDADATVKVDEMEAKHIGDKNFNVDADTADADAKITKTHAEIDALPNSKTVHIHEVTDGGGMNHGGMSGGGMDMGPSALASGVMTALPMAAPLLATATAGVMALSSAFAAAGAGAVGFGAVAAPTISKVITAANGGKNAMKGLDAQQRQAVGSLRSFQSFWNSFTASFQKPVLSAFTTSLKVMQTVLGALRPAIQGAANAFNGLLTDLQKSLGTPPVKAFFDYLGKMAGPMITAFGHIAGNVMLGVMNLLRAFGPLATQMVSGLVRMSAAFAQWSSRISSSKGFQQFIQYVRANGPVVMSIIGNLVSAIGHIVVALAPMGAAVLRVVQSFTQWLSSMTKAHPGLVQLAAGIVAGIGAINLMKSAVAGIMSPFRLLFSLVPSGVTRMVASFMSARVIPTIMRLIGSSFTFMMGPWGILIAAIAVGVALIITHWTQVRSFLMTCWNAIKSAAVSIWNGIRSFLSSIWNGIRSMASSVFNAIRSTISTIWNAIRNATSAIWGGIRGFLSGLWNGIRGTASGVFNGIRSVISSVWNAIRSVTSGVWNGIRGVISGVWNGIRGVVSGGANAIRSIMSGAWNAVRSGVSSAWNGIRSLIGGAIHGIGSMISGMAGQAFSWGANLIHMFGNGIKSAIGSVASAASSAVNSVKRFLGFHSPAEEGPGADADVWAPNLMKMFTRGITAGTPALQRALSRAITPPTSVINPNVSRLVNGTIGGISTTGASAASAAGGSFIVQGPLVKVDHMDARSPQDINNLQQQLYNAEATVRRAKGVKGI